MKINVYKTIQIVSIIFETVCVFIIALTYSFAYRHALTMPLEVTKTTIVQDANLGFFDILLLRKLGGAQNGPITSFNGTKADFIYQISKNKDWKVTLIPGETLELFFQDIAQDFNLSINLLKTAYYAKTDIPDGIIRPDTYFIKRDASEKQLVDRLINYSDKENEKLATELLGSYNKTYWNEYVLPKASVIQKEAVNATEMPLVSSVIDNRIKLGMPLQMDGSLNYGIYSHQKITPQRIKQDNSSYNTYKNKGLPKYPICSVSKDAIKAAVNPAKTDYLYFMRSNDGKHVFTKTFKDHRIEIENVKKSNNRKSN